jgi:rod shape determining protein RodA
VSARRIDWLLLGAVALLATASCLLVWSATSHRTALTGGDGGMFLRKQLVNVVIGVVLMAVVWATDHRWIRIVTPLVYVGSIGGLLLVLTNGMTINGSKSWIDVGGMSLQPSEFAKLAVVIGMALVLAERTEGRWRARIGRGDVVAMLLVAALPTLLIVMQPDLGTTLVLSATVFGVLGAAGTPRRWLGLLAAGAVTAAVAAVSAGVL